MMRLAIIGFLICMSAVASGQVGLSPELWAIDNLQSTDGNQKPVFTNSWLSHFRENTLDQRYPRPMNARPNSTLMTRPNLVYKPEHYGFFCKVESKIERKSRLAPRFRLGCVDYVDALEGKYVPPVR